jgi:hypothetical protein
MATIYSVEHRKHASANIVAITQRIRAGELDIVAGARLISGLRFDVAAEHDPDFPLLRWRGFGDRPFAVGDVRSRWSPDALKAMDEELQTYEASVRDRAFAVCRSLIQRYETHDASLKKLGD